MVNLLFAALLALLGGVMAQDDETPDALPWWNDRVFYQIFVRSFYDSDGDGIGDLRGITEKLDYLNDGDPDTQNDLGVTGIWLMPVAESPSYHGYDVADYKQIEADYGTAADFVELVEEAHARGIVVIVDLVINHTSNQHRWFLSALNPDSDYADWYHWQAAPSDEVGPWGQTLWHRAGGRYYYGLFWELDFGQTGQARRI
jgi:glycosidase